MGRRGADGGTTAAIAAAGAGVLALSACATTSRPVRPEPSPAPPPVLAPPAPPPPPQAKEPPLVFGFFRDGRVGKLFHGVPDTDDLDLTLVCRQGSERVAITDSAHPQAKSGQALTLTSGDARSTLPVQVEADDMDGGSLASAEAGADLPALLVFRKSGRIALRIGGREVTLTAKADAERAAIERFFAFCDRKR